MSIPNAENLHDEESFYLVDLFNSRIPELAHISFCGYQNVVYGGIVYNPLPLSITGLNFSTNGAESSPTLTIGDAKGAIGRILSAYKIEGSAIEIQKVKRRLLDSGATPNYLYRVPPDKFKLVAKLSQTGNQISYKLLNKGSLRTQVPARLLNNTCTWKQYRGPGCEYGGEAMFTVDNIPTNDPNLDICALTKKACKLRNNYDNFSGVPTINNF